MGSVHKVSACLLLVLAWTVVRGTGASPSDRFRRQTQRFQNFPATPQQPQRQQQQPQQQQQPPVDFNSARYQTQFSSPQLRSRASLQRQQQQQQLQQQQLGLPTPGSGRGLFDQIVKRINSGHRENARRKQNQDPNIRDQPRSRPPPAVNSIPPFQPQQPPRPIQISEPQAIETTQRPNLGLLLFSRERSQLSAQEEDRDDQFQLQQRQFEEEQ